MNQLLLRSVVLFAALGAALPAQESEKPKAEPPKVEAAPQNQAPALDDATTANDKAIVAIDAFIAGKKIEKTGAWREKLPMPQKQAFDPDSDYFLHMDTTAGPLKIKFFGDTAPMHVTNGIYLARLGFYDGLLFHRIIKGFMAQGGCPTGTGRGNPGYKFAGEFEGKRSHDKAGTLSTANAGPNTDGSQFFLTFGPTKQLDGGYTIWGEVVGGAATLKALEALGTAGEGRPTNPPSMQRVWVSVAKKAPAPAKEPAKVDGGDKK